MEVLISNSNTTEAYGMWSEQEQGHSPTFRELEAIHNVIESCVPLLAHRKVKLFSDNQGACTIVNKGSPKLILNQVAIDFFCVCWLYAMISLYALSGSQGRRTNVRILSLNFSIKMTKRLIR